jgi:ABC-2 type transport system ATP-binding protein
MNAVAVEGLTKKFAGSVALDRVSFTVAPGELFGFIGPDGAGKTTLFRILVTLLEPDAGRASVLGRDVVKEFRALRQRVGYMPGRFSLYPDLSVEENLRFFASVFGTTIDAERARIAPIYSQLEPFKARRAAALSGGMKQKLALCCALVHRPEILILDEPTTGVDLATQHEVLHLLEELNGEGISVLLATHDLNAVAAHLPRVICFNRGVVAVGDPETVLTADVLRRTYQAEIMVVETSAGRFMAHKTPLAIRRPSRRPDDGHAREPL